MARPEEGGLAKDVELSALASLGLTVTIHSEFEAPCGDPLEPGRAFEALAKEF